jgi:translation elongation factor EF-1beta
VNQALLTTPDDETDMKELEKNVRSIEKDGLLWGLSKFVPVGFGVKKLQINLVIEDEKISLDELQEQIEEDEDHVQSTDVVSYLTLYGISHANNHFSKLCRSCRVLTAKMADTSMIYQDYHV